MPKWFGVWFTVAGSLWLSSASRSARTFPGMHVCPRIPPKKIFLVAFPECRRMGTVKGGYHVNCGGAGDPHYGTEGVKQDDCVTSCLGS